MTAARVSALGRISPQAGSELALDTVRLGVGASAAVGGADRDTLLFVFAGGGTLAVGGQEHLLAAGSAALAVAGEAAAWRDSIA